MKTARLLLILALSFQLSGCTTYDRIKARTVEVWQSGKIQKTAFILAREVGMFVGGQVLALAVSGRDFGTKRDYLQGLTEALWSHSGDLVNPSTVQEIAAAWTPDNAHWQTLAEQLAADFAAKNPQSKEEVAAILNGYAQGIYISTEATK